MYLRLYTQALRADLPHSHRKQLSPTFLSPLDRNEIVACKSSLERASDWKLQAIVPTDDSTYKEQRRTMLIRYNTSYTAQYNVRRMYRGVPL